jgi:hypothetical protein
VVTVGDSNSTITLIGIADPTTISQSDFFLAG